VGYVKAQPVSARVLTPSGWKYMGEMKVGDRVNRWRRIGNADRWSFSAG